MAGLASFSPDYDYDYLGHPEHLVTVYMYYIYGYLKFLTINVLINEYLYKNFSVEKSQ